MTDKDIRYKSTDIGLPNPDKITGSNMDIVSPIIEGRMYEVMKYTDDDGNKYAVKFLRQDLANSDYYPNWDLDQIFSEHIKEHDIFAKHLPDFVGDAIFYTGVEPSGKKEYCIVQPWIEDGVQYKEAVKSERTLPEQQLPSLKDRLKFIEGLSSLLNDLGNKIPDLDFFISREKGGTKIRAFDTTGFWFERRGGKDRNQMASTLQHFLFTDKERSDPKIKEVLGKLETSVDFY